MARNCLARLNADSSLDITFNPNVSSAIYSLATQADSKLVIGGQFTTVGGVARNCLARLDNDTASQKLLFTGTASDATVQWLRGGASPEANLVTFEFSQDGTTWTSPVAAARIAGGWQLSNYNTGISANFVRARARTTGGEYSAIGLVELVSSTATPDISVEQPVGTILASNASTVDYGEFALGTTPAPSLTKNF